MMGKRKQIIYIGDPMCSWCYGFSPVMQHLFEKHKDEADMTLVTGGLHVGDNCLNDDARAAFLDEHWREIGARTGQKFKLDILQRRGWLYDTEPACRAVVTMRKLKPGSEYPYFAAVQAAFYAENQDTNDAATFAEAAAAFGIGADTFLETFNAEQTKQETMADFQWSRSMGVNGFPTVLVKDDEGYAMLTSGYTPLETVEAPLENWLKS